MTQKEWERKLLRNLKPLPKAERTTIAEYYREMYGDKLDAGLSPNEILQEFGSPKSCAEKILTENAADQYENTPENKRSAKPPFRFPTSDLSVAGIVGMLFLSLLIVLPLTCAAIIVIVSFGVVAVGGAILVIAGVFYFLLSPFMGISGLTGGAVIAHMGMGLALCGVGLLLFIAFSLLTKYTAIGSFKALTFIYKRRK